jgi:hypothetical protein
MRIEVCPAIHFSEHTLSSQYSLLNKNLFVAPKKYIATRGSADENLKGRVVLHELTHLDWFMNVPGTNKEIWDYNVAVRDGKSREKSYNTYGPLMTKILAKYKSKSTPYGYFTSTNADSYAMYTLARYVRSKLGE